MVASDGGPGVVLYLESVRTPDDWQGGTSDIGGALLGARCVGEEEDVGVAGDGQAGDFGGVVDVNGVSLGGSGGGLRGLEQRGRVHAYSVSDDGLGPWGEAEEACVGAALCDVCIQQVAEVPRVGVEPLACDGLPSFLLFFVSAECWAFVLQGAHGCRVRAHAVWVAVVVLDGYALRVCRTFAGERPLCRGCLGPGHVRWVARGYCVEPGREPRLLVCGDGGGGGVVVGGYEVQ